MQVESATPDEEETNAKRQFLIDSIETNMLGFSWGKVIDTLSAILHQEKVQARKRGILLFMASVYGRQNEEYCG